MEMSVMRRPHAVTAKVNRWALPDANNFQVSIDNNSASQTPIRSMLFAPMMRSLMSEFSNGGATLQVREQVTVLIVGGGPCGLTSALLLERAGIDFVLLERRDFTARVPRAHLLNVRTMEIFHDVGVADDIYAQCPPEDRWHRVCWYTSLAGPSEVHGREIGECPRMGWRPGPRPLRAREPAFVRQPAADPTRCAAVAPCRGA